MQNKIPTIQEIARILKLSKSTVSRALRNHPAIGLRTTQQVQQLARELNYEPNQMAISFSKKKTMSIGVIVSSLDPYFHRAVFGIEDCAYANNYNVLISQTRDEYDIEVKVLETMRKQRVDGIVAAEDLLGDGEVAVEERAGRPSQRFAHETRHAHDVVAHDVELVVEDLAYFDAFDHQRTSDAK